MKLSTEQLKELRVLCNDSTAWASVLDELIAIRELKGDQVPVAWTSQRSLETKNKIVAFTDDMSALDYGVANGWTDIVELFTAPQKPVMLPPVEKWRKPDEVRAQNAYRVAVRKEIEAAGGIVKDGE